MRPQYTYELRLDCAHLSSPQDHQTKNVIIAWMHSHGITAFVEGVVDNVDLDVAPDHATALEQIEAFERQISPLSLYSYDCEYLEDVKVRILHDVPLARALIHCSSTSEWVEGWKESFKPITTDHFYIYPPWLADELPDGKHTIQIEPAMAFGTGQHATTRLCLQAIGNLEAEIKGAHVLDLGCGTGILAIAAKQFGAEVVEACDIESDAISASLENSKVNHVAIKTWVGSIGEAVGPYDLVIANILAPVIDRLLPDMVARLTSSGQMILSGILSEQAPGLWAKARAQNLVLIDEQEQSGWVVGIFKREHIE